METTNPSATKPSTFVHHFVCVKRPSFASTRRLTSDLQAVRVRASFESNHRTPQARFLGLRANRE